MKHVLDFSGYYINNKFTIKEYCPCRIYKNRTIAGKLLVIKPPHFTKSFDINHYNKNYYPTYGIKWNIGNCADSYVRNQINSLLYNKLNKNIYVRNQEQKNQLMSYLGKQFNNIKLMTDLKYMDIKILGTSCQYHDNKLTNYCARNTAMNMINWLFNKIVRKTLSRSFKQVVINFTGYLNNNREFLIKELSIYGLKDTGEINYHKLYVTKPPGNTNNLQRVIDNYNKNYYSKYGIKWDTGYYDLKELRRKLRTTLKQYRIKIIFVLNVGVRKRLEKVIGDNYKINCLKKYNYEDKVLVRSNCGNHTNEEGNNLCVEDGAKSMLNWILKNKFYKSEVRNKFKGSNTEEQEPDMGSGVDLKSNDFNLDNFEPRKFSLAEIESLLNNSGSDESDLEKDDRVLEVDDEILNNFDLDNFEPRKLSSTEIETLLNNSGLDGSDLEKDDRAFEVDDEILNNFDLDTFEPYKFSSAEIESLLNNSGSDISDRGKDDRGFEVDDEILNHFDLENFEPCKFSSVEIESLLNNSGSDESDLGKDDRDFEVDDDIFNNFDIENFGIVQLDNNDLERLLEDN